MSRHAACLYRDCLCFNWSDVAPYTHELIGYACGGLFAAGWWLFIDAVVYAGSHSLPVPILFEDYVPGILATIALVMVNSVDKNLLNGQDFSYSGNAAWRARLFAFIGIALSVGSLGGAVTIMCLKYLNAGYVAEEAWPGIAFVIQNFLIFLRFVVLAPAGDDS
ncbi:Vacuolar protein sorting-associated protein 68 [Sorochytrium milnesiophthora]